MGTAWIEFLEDLFLSRRSLFALGVRFINEDQSFSLGKIRAEKNAKKAFQKVPAYKEFLMEHNLSNADYPLEKLPVMTKDCYIRKYPTQLRCIGGTYLKKGVAIDESSGSTGIPYNWVRGGQERVRVHRTLSRMLEWVLGTRPRIAINAFSMGAWATGVNMGEALELHSVVKSTGPDLEKIMHTLQFFGPEPGYFICGYPPFVKLVLDTMIERDYPVEKYELHAMVGGEGMSEELRDYLLKHFKSCISGYGASDLEMGLAVETPEAVLVRKLLNKNKQIREKILKGDHRVPMVFQFNPLTHYIETNEKNELIITLNYSKILSPRIRYNVGDEGLVIKRSELLKQLEELGYPVKVDCGVLHMPFLMLFGRKDQTISVMGSNIYPEDIERAIYLQPDLAAGFCSFMISVREDQQGNPRPHIAIEWKTEKVPNLDFKKISALMTSTLEEINSDFKNARKEYAEVLNVEIELHGFSQGPFQGRGHRIKNRYLGGK